MSCFGFTFDKSLLGHLLCSAFVNWEALAFRSNCLVTQVAAMPCYLRFFLVGRTQGCKKIAVSQVLCFSAVL